MVSTAGASGARRPAQHDDLEPERARRGDLAVGRAAAAVLGDDDVDAMLGHQRALVGLAERPAGGRRSSRAAPAAAARPDRRCGRDRWCCGACVNGAISLRPSARKTLRGVGPERATASPASLTSIQRSPATAVHAGRRSATHRHTGFGAAATAFAEMTLAYGCVASISAAMCSLTEIVREAAAPPKPPTRNGTGWRAGAAVRPASDTVTSRSERPAEPLRKHPRLAVPPRMRMRGMSLPDAIARDTAASPRWLSIVGIGEDGVDGLSAAARGLIGAAEIVFGGRRHLALRRR